MKTLRLLWRLIFFVVYTTCIVAEIWIRRVFFKADMHAAMHIRRRWAKHLLTNVGVRLSTYGIPPDYPCILVANHRSYLDPILMLCHVDAYPVAKAELAEWPLMGKGAQLAGILYLRREDGHSRAGILKAMSEKLSEGFSIIIFPEGTTSALEGTLPFKRGVFQLAARQQWPIVPVALHFPDSRDFWIGRVSFLAHAWSRFGQPDIWVDMHYGPPLRSTDTRQLADEARTWIETTLRQA